MKIQTLDRTDDPIISVYVISDNEITNDEAIEFLQDNYEYHNFIEFVEENDPALITHFQAKTVFTFHVDKEEIELIKNHIYNDMKTLIHEGETLTTETYTGKNPNAFKEFSDVNNYPLFLTIEVFNENEHELNEIYNEN